MKVAIDTNIIVQDFWLGSPHSKVFLEQLNIIPAKLYIPEIVIDESINKYGEFLQEKFSEQKKISVELERLLNKKTIQPVISIEDAVNEYSLFLNKRVFDLGAQILPYPKSDHKDIVKHILDRRRPFKKGDAGYRDFLIWQTIRNLEIWGAEEIVFITNNTRDFGDNGFLSEEFVDKRTTNKNFKIITSVSMFNNDYIIPRLEKLERLKSQLNEENVHHFNFKNWLDNDFIESLKDCDVGEVIAGFPQDVGRVNIVEILVYNDFEIDQVLELQSNERFIHFKVNCKVRASIDIEWEEYIAHSEVRDYFGHSEEFGSLSTMTSDNIEVNGFLILDKNNKDVKSFEITFLGGSKGFIDSEQF